MNEPNVPALVVGHTVRTTNATEVDPSTARISKLWSRVLEDTTLLQWSGRTRAAMYAVYYDYESDQCGAYSVLVGVEATSATNLPPRGDLVQPDQANRVGFEASPPLPAGIINAWKQVWVATAAGGLVRDFTTDVEVYRPDGSAVLLIAGASGLLDSA